jgi:hypothetical protein
LSQIVSHWIIQHIGKVKFRGKALLSEVKGDITQIQTYERKVKGVIMLTKGVLIRNKRQSTQIKKAVTLMIPIKLIKWHCYAEKEGQYWN